MRHWDSFITPNECYTQSGKSKTWSDFRILHALHRKAKERQELRWVTLGSHFYTFTNLWVVFSLSTLYFKTVDWSLTTQIKQWESNVVLVWAGICREGWNTSSPKSACMGGYTVHWINQSLIRGCHNWFSYQLSTGWRLIRQIVLINFDLYF